MKWKKIIVAVVFLVVLGLGFTTGSKEAQAYNNWELKRYNANYQTYAYGMYQVGSRTLAPIGFKWYENGIPMNAVNYSLGLSQASFTFKADKVWDMGKPRIYDQGYYYKQFGTPWGTFYAKASNIRELVYK